MGTKPCAECGVMFTPKGPKNDHCWACFARLQHAEDWPLCKQCQRFYESGFDAGLQLGQSRRMVPHPVWTALSTIAQGWVSSATGLAAQKRVVGAWLQQSAGIAGATALPLH